MDDAREFVTVRPVNTVHASGKVYEYKYRFNHVAVDEALDMEGELFPHESVETWEADGRLVYRFRRNDAIRIGEKDVVMAKTADRKQARNDAYAALSMMDDQGLVAGWRKA